MRSGYRGPWLPAPRSMPWKNGGGITHELWREPAEPAPFDLRISVAEVATDGPFSLFPGVDRVLALVSGAGFRIRGPKGEYAFVVPGAPVGFAGEDPWDCSLLAGPVRDFNVMVRRESGLQAAVLSGVSGPLPTGARFVFALGPGVSFGQRGDRLEVPPERLAVIEAADGELETPPAASIVVVLRAAASGRRDERTPRRTDAATT